jgi:hypothetical protein
MVESKVVFQWKNKEESASIANLFFSMKKILY